MAVNLGEAVYWNSPILLGGADNQYYFHRGNDNRWFWQEKEHGNWKEPAELARRGEALCAVLDSQLGLHLVMLDSGSFYHLQLQGGRFTEALLYTEESKRCSHLLLGGDSRGNLHLVYLAVDSDAARWWLLHHRRAENGWEEPRVIDFGGGASLNYGSIALDRNDGLHLVYRITGENQVTLYYRVFNPDSLNWGKAFTLSAAKEICYPSINLDHAQNMHVAWTAAGESGYSVSYRPMLRGGWPSGGWKPETTISPDLHEKPFPLFTYQQGQLAMGWLSGGRVALYRYKDGHWEQGQQQQVENPLPVRSVSCDPPGPSLLYWSLAQGDEPLSLLQDLPGGASGSLDDLESEFLQLQQSSEALVNRASSLSTSKARLERSLEEKRKELVWMSQQKKKAVQGLQQKLEQKDKELHQLEEKLNQATQNIKSKTEQARKNWEEEKKRYLREMQALKKERLQFDQLLKEKENTIARLEARHREQEFTIKNLVNEKEALSAQLRDKGWSIRKFIGKLLHNKP